MVVANGTSFSPKPERKATTIAATDATLRTWEVEGGRVVFDSVDDRISRVTMPRDDWEAIPRERRPDALLSRCGRFVQFDEPGPASSG